MVDVIESEMKQSFNRKEYMKEYMRKKRAKMNKTVEPVKIIPEIIVCEECRICASYHTDKTCAGREQWSGCKEHTFFSKKEDANSCLRLL